MSTLTCWLFVVTLMLAYFSCGPGAFAVADKENQGRWTKPTENNKPDKEVPGFLVNLGPTDARAVLTETTFIVKYIFKESPAVDRLKLDDEIVGAFGKPCSAHRFKGGHGHEGQIMDLGEAIEKAEGKDGKLALNLRNGSSVKDVRCTRPEVTIALLASDDSKRQTIIDLRIKDELADEFACVRCRT